MTNTYKPETKKQNLLVYPNPIDDILQVKVSNEAIIQHAYIFDLSGHLILTQQWDDSQVEEVTIHTATLPSGMYFIQVNTEQGVFSKKIIKQ